MFTSQTVARGSRRRLIAGAIALLSIALLGACSGDDSDPLSAADAAAIASGALLQQADLPEADWTQQESQTGLDGLLPDGAGNVDLDILPEACESLEDALGDLPSLLGDAAPLASSSRSFTAIGQLLNLDAVSSTVVVFANADDAEAAAEAVDDALSVDNLEGCVQQAIGVASDDGLQIVEFSFTTPSYALEDSTALAANVEAIALILPINLGLDIHTFQRDNVLALYVAIDVNSNRLEGEHAALLATFANRIAEAQTEAG